MSAPRFLITTEPLDLRAVMHAATAGSRSAGDAGDVTPESDGAVASFLGIVRDRNLGRRVERLEYEAYEPLAIKAFQRIATESVEFWPSTRMALHHRIGELGVGEASIAIASASPHRAEAFASCRYAIERVKQIAPIWKHEFFEGGDVWIEGATADPEDDAARKEACRRSCA